MSGTVEQAKIESKSQRARLKRGRQPYWRTITPGKTHLGYQVERGDAEGRWVLRRYLGKEESKNKKLVARYRVETLGRADDSAKANGIDILSYEQADEKARSIVASPAQTTDPEKYTVRQAMADYITYLKSQGQSSAVKDIESRGTAHILPSLGDLVVSKLTADAIRKWLASMAASPAQYRPKRKGKDKVVPNYRAPAETDEEIRRRRATANRVWSMLRALLNHAYRDGKVASRDEWTRVKPFKQADAARPRYLQLAEAKRLINASDPDFRALVHGALQTGCRYSELARLTVGDFHPDSDTVLIRRAKGGKGRSVVLTAEGAEFFRAHTAGRAGDALMFTHDDGSEWKTAEQARPMKEACERANIKGASFHCLRHSWASHSVMAGMSLMVVARNLGHVDTRMVEKHYGHLAPSYVAKEVREKAPRFGIKVDTKVTPLGR